MCCNFRSASPDNGEHNTRGRGKRKEWEAILPKSEIRTRGAKIPDYKLHLKIRPSKREQKAIEKNSLRESIGFAGRGRGKLGKAAMDKKGVMQAPVTGWTLEPAFKLSDIPQNFHSVPNSR